MQEVHMLCKRSWRSGSKLQPSEHRTSPISLCPGPLKRKSNSSSQELVHRLEIYSRLAHHTSHEAGPSWWQKMTKTTLPTKWMRGHLDVFHLVFFLSFYIFNGVDGLINVFFWGFYRLLPRTNSSEEKPQARATEKKNQSKQNPWESLLTPLKDHYIKHII